jgi:hypothetical protein
VIRFGLVGEILQSNKNWMKIERDGTLFSTGCRAEMRLRSPNRQCACAKSLPWHRRGQLQHSDSRSARRHPSFRFKTKLTLVAGSLARCFSRAFAASRYDCNKTRRRGGPGAHPRHRPPSFTVIVRYNCSLVVRFFVPGKIRNPTTFSDKAVGPFTHR